MKGIQQDSLIEVEVGIITIGIMAVLFLMMIGILLLCLFIQRKRQNTTPQQISLPMKVNYV